MNTETAIRNEQADAALDHYQRLADEACEHHSVIPQAIEAWRKMPEMRARQAIEAWRKMPELRARIAALEEENERLRRRHIGTDLSIEEILVDLCEDAGYSEVMLVMEYSDKLLELKRREEESE